MFDRLGGAVVAPALVRRILGHLTAAGGPGRGFLLGCGLGAGLNRCHVGLAGAELLLPSALGLGLARFRASPLAQVGSFGAVGFQRSNDGLASPDVQCGHSEKVCL